MRWRPNWDAVLNGVQMVMIGALLLLLTVRGCS